MSSKKNLDVKIGFGDKEENEGSLVLSEFGIEGKSSGPISFFSESENLKDEKIENKSLDSEKESSEEHNGSSEIESRGLNHGFFEENADSISEKDSRDYFIQGNESTGVPATLKPKKAPAIPLENNENEIIISKTNQIDEILKKNNKKIEKEKTQPKSSFCCKCKDCLIF
jgi:tRNA(Leu) C34 or U34 (ribose-2'-O)-methylase TrmL